MRHVLTHHFLAFLQAVVHSDHEARTHPEVVALATKAVVVVADQMLSACHQVVVVVMTSRLWTAPAHMDKSEGAFRFCIACSKNELELMS